MTYAEVYKDWQEDPEEFWLNAAKDIDWITPPTQALFADDAPFYEWFKDTEVNTCYNAVDRHVENGRADQVAIIYDSPVTGTKNKITYAQLQTQVAKLAGAMQAKNVLKGDRVLVYMPMTPQAVIAMLACSRMGAIPYSCFWWVRCQRAGYAD